MPDQSIFADDRLGRVLDQLYLAGLTQLFVSIALKAAAKYGVATDTVHLDSSSFHVHGNYKSEAAQLSVVVDKATLVEPESDGEAVPKPIHRGDEDWQWGKITQCPIPKNLSSTN